MINNNPLTNLSSIGVEFSAPGDPDHKVKKKQTDNNGKVTYTYIHTETLPPTSDQIKQFRHTKKRLDTQA
jgi:hypothetical protein